MSTLWPAFQKCSLVHPRKRDPIVGRPCPQPRVGGALLDDVLGTGFAIVYRGPNRVAAYDPPIRDFFDRLGTTVVRVDDLPDGGGALIRLLDNARADALLLRPDRVAAAAAGTPDLRAWQRHLRTAGINPAESPQDVRSPR